MKKLLFLAVALLVGCTTINQLHTYGVVESGVKVNGHYQYKVWSGSKYYTVISDSVYMKGSRIKIK